MQFKRVLEFMDDYDVLDDKVKEWRRSEGSAALVCVCVII